MGALGFARPSRSAWLSALAPPRRLSISIFVSVRVERCRHKLGPLEQRLWYQDADYGDNVCADPDATGHTKCWVTNDA
jgi:hypothetical protein